MPAENYTNTVSRLDERLKSVQTDVEKIKSVLEDNGQEGLATRVIRIEERHESLLKVTEEQSAQIDALSKGIGQLHASVGEILKAQEKLMESPSIMMMVRSDPLKALGVLASLFTAGVTLWLLMYAFVHIPGVNIFLAELLKLPVDIPLP